MPAIFLVSDTHFGHAGVCRFTHEDTGAKIRPWDNPDEMDEAMVQAWNETVGPNDKVYHLGDVVMHRKSLPIMNRLNGDKVLIRGNHDIFKDEDYAPYFRSLRGVHVMDGMIFTHIPIHEHSIGRFGVNIHGHLHSQRVKKDGVIDPRYHNVSVEQTNFRPILLEDVLTRIREEGGHIGFRSGNSSAM